MTEAAGMQGILECRLRDYALDHTLSPRQWQVCSHIQACRTEALGGLALHCEACGYDTAHYHACRDRHCPRCQRQASESWCERQRDSVLPVPYYHLVFTLPHALNGWVGLHDEVIYASLFRSAWSTLSALAADPKRLGGELGMTAVLHTWGQDLGRHVHLHCLVPGGALDEDGHWLAARENYLFPVRALSRHFRGRMVGALRAARRAGELDRITRPGEIDRVLDELMCTDWVVYAKPCLSHTGSVVEYLARYSHRIAIGDTRIEGLEADGRVAFRYHDYRHGRRHRTMRLEAGEFIRRFLLHVLPKGFVRIRHYGFLANRCRREKLARIRSAIGQWQAAPPETEETREDRGAFDDYPCPRCGERAMRVTGELAPRRLAGGYG